MHNQKKAFSLVEMSVVIVILAVLLSALIVSRTLITIAKINRIVNDARDIQVLTDIFRNTFDCIAGDCSYKELPKSISSQVPSACFNLQSDYETPLTTPVINTGFGTDQIDSNAKRTCMFYEFMALEPQAFGLPRGSLATNKMNSIFGINVANAIQKLDKNNATQFLVSPWIASCPANAKYCNEDGFRVRESSYSLQPFLTACTSNGNIINKCMNTSSTFYTDNFWGASYEATSSFSIPTTIDGQTKYVIGYLYKHPDGLTLRFYYSDTSTANPDNVAVATSLKKIYINKAEMGSACTGGTNPVDVCQIALKAIYTDQNKSLLELQQDSKYDWLSRSYLGISNPQVPGLTSSMWDARTINATAPTYPYESGYLDQTKGKIMLIARDNSTNNINSTDTSNVSIVPQNDILASFDSSFSQKLDRKADDGMPYTGNIVAGKNVAAKELATGCTNVTFADWADVTNNLTAKYNVDTDIANGCVVGFVIKT